MFYSTLYNLIYIGQDVEFLRLPWISREFRLFICMLIVVPLAGQLYFYPFNGSFSISFGTPAFFFSLLLLRRIPAVLSGVAAGSMVVFMRVLFDLSIYDKGLPDSFLSH